MTTISATLADWEERAWSRSADLDARTISRRRDLHRHPELGWCEFRTSAMVVDVLTQLGWGIRYGRQIPSSAPRRGVPASSTIEKAAQLARESGVPEEMLTECEGGYTAVVATLGFGGDGPNIGIRCDMDGLPIVESATEDHLPQRLGFRSTVESVMHACGHDGHVAMGLALAEAITQLRVCAAEGDLGQSLKGTVTLLFQPAEEGNRGAEFLVSSGMVEGIDYLIAPHIGLGATTSGVVSGGATGILATSKGLASIAGRSAHAGVEPEKGDNALLAAAHAIIGMHGISRHSQGGSRVNVGTLHADGASNVVCDNAVLRFETRGTDDAINDYTLRRVTDVLRGAAAMQGVEVDITDLGTTPSALSDEKIAELVRDVAADVPGIDEAVAFMEHGASDDATILMRAVQECGGMATYSQFGSNLADGHHRPHFDFDETTLKTGSRVLFRAVAALLSDPPG